MISPALIAAMAVLSQQAGDTADVSPELWQGLRAGMTPAEIRAVLPENKVELAEGCHAQVWAQSERSRGLVKVSLRYGTEVTMSQGAATEAQRCVNIVVDSLLSKYGKAEETEPSPRPRIGNPTAAIYLDQREPRVTDRWQRGSVVISNTWSVRAGVVSYEFIPPPEAPRARNPAAASRL